MYHNIKSLFAALNTNSLDEAWLQESLKDPAFIKAIADSSQLGASYGLFLEKLFSYLTQEILNIKASPLVFPEWKKAALNSLFKEMKPRFGLSTRQKLIQPILDFIEFLNKSKSNNGIKDLKKITNSFLDFMATAKDSYPNLCSLAEAFLEVLATSFNEADANSYLGNKYSELNRHDMAKAYLIKGNFESKKRLLEQYKLNPNSLSPQELNDLLLNLRKQINEKPKINAESLNKEGDTPEDKIFRELSKNLSWLFLQKNNLLAYAVLTAALDVDLPHPALDSPADFKSSLNHFIPATYLKDFDQIYANSSGIEKAQIQRLKIFYWRTNRLLTNDPNFLLARFQLIKKLGRSLEAAEQYGLILLNTATDLDSALSEENRKLKNHAKKILGQYASENDEVSILAKLFLAVEKQDLSEIPSERIADFEVQIGKLEFFSDAWKSEALKLVKNRNTNTQILYPLPEILKVDSHLLIKTLINYIKYNQVRINKFTVQEYKALMNYCIEGIKSESVNHAEAKKVLMELIKYNQKGGNANPRRVILAQAILSLFDKDKKREKGEQEPFKSFFEYKDEKNEEHDQACDDLRLVIADLGEQEGKLVVIFPMPPSSEPPQIEQHVSIQFPTPSAPAGDQEMQKETETPSPTPLHSQNDSASSACVEAQASQEPTAPALLTTETKQTVAALSEEARTTVTDSSRESVQSTVSDSPEASTVTISQESLQSMLAVISKLMTEARVLKEEREKDQKTIAELKARVQELEKTPKNTVIGTLNFFGPATVMLPTTASKAEMKTVATQTELPEYAP